MDRVADRHGLGYSCRRSVVGAVRGSPWNRRCSCQLGRARCARANVIRRRRRCRAVRFRERTPARARSREPGRTDSARNPRAGTRRDGDRRDRRRPARRRRTAEAHRAAARLVVGPHVGPALALPPARGVPAAERGGTGRAGSRRDSTGRAVRVGPSRLPVRAVLAHLRGRRGFEASVPPLWRGLLDPGTRSSAALIDDALSPESPRGTPPRGATIEAREPRLAGLNRTGPAAAMVHTVRSARCLQPRSRSE